MQLTIYTDYSLRVLLFLARNPDLTSTITEVANFYKISRNHLVKVVYQLAQLGYIKSLRGKNGGILLAKPANQINIAEVVKKTEKTFNLVECFDEVRNRCAITGYCKLKGILAQALDAYLAVLEKYTLADACDERLTFLIKQVLHK